MNRYRVEWSASEAGYLAAGAALVVAHTAADAKVQAEIRIGPTRRLLVLEPVQPGGAPVACSGCGRWACHAWVPVEPAP